jgi:F-box and WD-40 domain protein MET30
MNAAATWDGRPMAPSHHEVEAIQPSGCLPDLDSGEILFSASGDASIRLWDLTNRTCVRQFNGHLGQVQNIRVVYTDHEESNEDRVVKG